MLLKTLSKLLPHQCSLCRLTIIHQSKNTPFLWCSSCLQLIYQQSQNSQYRCQRCGLPTTTLVAQCGQCLTEPPPWDRLFCIGDYQSPLKDAIHQLKYQRQYWLAQNLSSLLLPIITAPAPECIPVPLHWFRQLTRSFNQSEILAQHLVHLWRKQGYNVELSTILRRTSSTQAQKGLDKKQRQNNVKNAFELSKSPIHSHVALIDDVVTTGSTLAPICKLLRNANVKQIDVYCLCRTALLT